MPVKPVPSAIGGLVVEVDVAAAGSVVVMGEGDAGRPEALGAPSKVVKRYPEPHGQVTAYNRSPVY